MKNYQISVLGLKRLDKYRERMPSSDSKFFEYRLLDDIEGGIDTSEGDLVFGSSRSPERTKSKLRSLVKEGLITEKD